MNREFIQIRADVVELVRVGLLGKRDAVVEGLETFLDVLGAVLEVQHEGLFLARRGAVQAGERLHAGHAAEFFIHIHGQQLQLIESRLEFAGDDQEAGVVRLEAIPVAASGKPFILASVYSWPSLGSFTTSVKAPSALSGLPSFSNRHLRRPCSAPRAGGTR